MNNRENLGRQAITSFLRGLWLGLGFSLATVMVSMVAIPMLNTRLDSTTTFDNMEADTEARLKHLAVTDVEEKKVNGQDWIIGSVRNGGNQPVRAVKVEADLFDHGKFTDQYSTSISGSISPGESRFFKISCGCKDSQPAEHDSFKVQVVREY